MFQDFDERYSRSSRAFVDGCYTQSMQRRRVGSVSRCMLYRYHSDDNRAVFLDAPHVLSPADLAETFNTPEELGASDAADPDPAMQPRGWWKVDRTRTKLTGIEASFELLRDTLKKDRYVVSGVRFLSLCSPDLPQGVFGFSQGAAMAALLAALVSNP